MDAISDPAVENVVVMSSSQVGKALAIDTPIPTPQGWKTMGELNPGDWVFDEYGQPCRVTFATNVMHNRPCYRVKFSDGSEIVADADHQWQVTANTKWKVQTTKQILARLLSKANHSEHTDGKTPQKNTEVISVPATHPIVMQGTSYPGHTQRQILHITPRHSVPVRCIQVDSPNSLYLADHNMVPTHNTELENNALGYYIHQDPAPIMLVMPTERDAETWSKDRFAPMARDTPCLHSKIGDPKSCLLYTSPSPRDKRQSRMPSSA